MKLLNLLPIKNIVTCSSRWVEEDRVTSAPVASLYEGDDSSTFWWEVTSDWGRGSLDLLEEDRGTSAAATRLSEGKQRTPSWGEATSNWLWL